MSILETALQNSNVRPAITAEITPPKGAGIKKFLNHAELLRPHVHALNVTDCQRALVRMSSLVASKILLDQGIEPVLQMTCRDRNSIALQGDLMGASALKIPNMLALTGDPVKVGDSPQSKSVFEFETLGLLKVIQKLSAGRDMNDHVLTAPTRLFVGAVVNPTMQHGTSQLSRAEKKVELGARFFQTQANYDNEDCFQFLTEMKKLNTKVMAGILIIPGKTMAEHIYKNIPGIRMPEHIYNDFMNCENPEEFGIDFAVKSMQTLQSVCDGFHLMSIRAEHLIPKVLEKYHGTIT